MAKSEVRLDCRQALRLHGLWARSNDKSVARDIPRLTARYHQITGTGADPALPFFILSRNFEEKTRYFELFVGSITENAKLEPLLLPEGQYGRIAVAPKLGFLWGPAIGGAKRWFYTKWLPGSGFQAVNLEYEYHTEKSLGKSPEIELFFAIRR